MQKKKIKFKFLLLFVFSLIFLSTPQVLAQIRLDMEMFNKFKGTIAGKYKVRMVLYPTDKRKILGNYFYEKYEKKIPLKGYYDENKVIVFEFNSKGDKVAKLIGKIVGEHIKFKGKWISLKSRKRYKFNLNLYSTFPGLPNNMYADAGADSSQKVENFTKKLKKNILNKNKKKVASKIAYPIKVQIANEKNKIQNKKEFIKKFNKIFYKEFLNSIKKSFPLNMSANYEGIMFGERGQIWLGYVSNNNSDSKLKVININNYRSMFEE